MTNNHSFAGIMDLIGAVFMWSVQALIWQTICQILSGAVDSDYRYERMILNLRFNNFAKLIKSKPQNQIYKKQFIPKPYFKPRQQYKRFSVIGRYCE